MATVEELVISLLVRTNDAEQRLSAAEQRLNSLEQSGKGAQQALDKTAESAKKAGDAVDKAGQSTEKAGGKARKVGQDAKKAGDEVERAGRKARGSANLLDKSIARLGKGWTKTLVGYMTGFLMAGTIISTIKNLIAGTLETATAVGKISEASGQSRKEVYALGKAFESLGQSQESAYKWLTDWNDAQASADVGQVSKVEQAAKTVGIKTRENGRLRRGQDVLVEMGQKAVADSGGDKDLAAKRLQALGIEEQTAKAAVRATKELIAEKEKNNLVTEEQLAKAQEVSAKFKSLKSGAGDFVDAIGMALMPTLGDIIDGGQNVIDFLKGMAKGFEEAGDGAVGFSDVLEVIFAPLNIVIELVRLLFGGLSDLSGWASTGGQIVYGFFTAMQNVWNAVIGVINGVIAGIESLINGLGQLGAAISRLPGAGPAYEHKEIKLGRLNELGKGGGKSAPPTGNTNPGRGKARGSYGLGSGSGGGRSGGGRARRGGGGGRSSAGSSGKQEPVYHSKFQGTGDPKKLGITPAIARLPEDPVKKAAQEAKKTGGKGSPQPSQKTSQTVSQAVPAKQEAVPVIVKNAELKVREVAPFNQRLADWMKPVLGAVNAIKPDAPFELSAIHAGAKQVAGGTTKNIHITNSITVHAPGNTNARQIADRTSQAVNMISRRQAGAMAV